MAKQNPIPMANPFTNNITVMRYVASAKTGVTVLCDLIYDVGWLAQPIILSL